MDATGTHFARISQRMSQLFCGFAAVLSSLISQLNIGNQVYYVIDLKEAHPAFDLRQSLPVQYLSEETSKHYSDNKVLDRL